MLSWADQNTLCAPLSPSKWKQNKAYPSLPHNSYIKIFFEDERCHSICTLSWKNLWTHSMHLAYQFAIIWNIEIICQQKAPERLDSALSYNPRNVRGQMLSSLMLAEGVCQTPEARGQRGRCHPHGWEETVEGTLKSRWERMLPKGEALHLLQLQAQGSQHVLYGSLLLASTHCGTDHKDSSHLSRKKRGVLLRLYTK